VVIALVFIHGICCVYGSEILIVNKSFNKREIKVKVGGMIRVELEELGAAGYTWKLQSLGEEHFEIQEVQVKSAPPKDESTGAPVARRWLIRAKKAGQSELRFVHSRSWEDEKSESDAFVLRIRIIP
jgi:predicted secreted protein